MNRKLRVVVSAMLLSFEIGRAFAAEPSLEQLAQIEFFLSGNDVAGLRRFLEINPELLSGETDLALLLRRFLAESRNLASFLHAPDLRDALITATPRDDPVNEGSDLGEEPAEGGEPDGEPIY